MGMGMVGTCAHQQGGPVCVPQDADPGLTCNRCVLRERKRKGLCRSRMEEKQVAAFLPQLGGDERVEAAEPVSCLSTDAGIGRIVVEMQGGTVRIRNGFIVWLLTARSVLSPVSIAGEMALAQHFQRVLYREPKEAFTCERMGGGDAGKRSGPHGEQGHIEKDGNRKH